MIAEVQRTVKSFRSALRLPGRIRSDKAIVSWSQGGTKKDESLLWPPFLFSIFISNTWSRTSGAAPECYCWKGTGWERISHWGSKYVFYKKYTIQTLDMQQWSMKEVVSIFPVTSHFHFSSLIAVFMDISSQLFYFSDLWVANEDQRDLEIPFACFTSGLSLGFSNLKILINCSWHQVMMGCNDVTCCSTADAESTVNRMGTQWKMNC